MSDLADTWKRISDWLSSNAPEALSELQPPATEQEIARVVAAVGALPDDYVTLMQIHNGAEERGFGIGTFEGFVLYSLEAALHAREVMQRVAHEGREAYPDVADNKMEPDHGVRRTWWHDAWLPIAVAEGDSRTMIFLDLDPAPGGVRGQLVRHVIEMHTLPVVARSVSEWLGRIALAMESGRVTIEREPAGLDEEDGHLVYLTWAEREDSH